jgi:hypothetical protein
MIERAERMRGKGQKSAHRRWTVADLSQAERDLQVLTSAMATNPSAALRQHLERKREEVAQMRAQAKVPGITTSTPTRSTPTSPARVVRTGPVAVPDAHGQAAQAVWAYLQHGVGVSVGDVHRGQTPELVAARAVGALRGAGRGVALDSDTRLAITKAAHADTPQYRVNWQAELFGRVDEVLQAYWPAVQELARTLQRGPIKAERVGSIIGGAITDDERTRKAHGQPARWHGI